MTHDMGTLTRMLGITHSLGTLSVMLGGDAWHYMGRLAADAVWERGIASAYYCCGPLSILRGNSVRARG